MRRKLTPSQLALWAALPMAHTPRIEGRLTMILDTTRPRRALSRRILLAALGVGAAALVPLAVLRPAARAQAAPPLAANRPVAKRHISEATARVSAVSAVAGEFDAMRLESEARSLTPSAVTNLERQIAARPDDYAAHIRLLGYYGAGRFRSAASRTAYDRQVFWLIRTHPESVLSGTPETMVLKRDDPAGFEEGKTLWLAQVAAHPTNTLILGKAADYCVLSDNGTAERLLRQAAALEPKNPQWPDELGGLYQLQGTRRGLSSQEQRLWARKALAEWDFAATLPVGAAPRHATSAVLAKTAFAAGDYDRARRYATALLRRGDAHEANMVLGRLALRDGDTAGAEAHLLAMGRVSGSPSLDTFGPNMQLAKDLLDRGDRQPVLVYFDECARFWTFDHGAKLKQWRALVREGKTPDFGGNLVY